MISIEANHVCMLQELSINPEDQNDPFDQIIISQALTDKLVLISADRKFPFYVNQGLKLVVN
jgi:PIN domain nuclease of toxin-antitoxin system